MPMDIFLEYLIDSTSSMPIYLDENIFAELEDSWRWRHMMPGFFTDDVEDELVMNWIKDTLAESDVLGVEDFEFNERLALALKSEDFLVHAVNVNRRCGSQDLPRNALFGLEYALRSGKLGDPEDFLDTNILPCLDAVSILYNDWTVLKERRTARKYKPNRHSQKTLMPLSNVTNNVRSPACLLPVLKHSTSTFNLQSAKRRVPLAENLAIFKKRKRGPSFSGSRSVLKATSSKQTCTAKNTKDCYVDKEAVDRIAGPTYPATEESEIRRLIKILEETVEHVEDLELVETTLHFQA
ncbi:hypothetical protein J3R30DRAFT_3404457 [Lentinula aciculospora]|uniref:Uncharacterized protein n=1 Tax=Lentinula aciculospora TaxID=153920 RepID=A0A9W9ABY5_9AGAR|nr:hypothetical protein J3R30DRAFT_3404457 [Lentinula aciculospora]